MKHYGTSWINKKLSKLEKHVENIKIRGYTIVDNVLENDIVNKVRESLDKYYKIQEFEFGLENLKKINEVDIIRAPLLYDNIFLELVTDPFILEIIKSIIGKEVILHLQNGIINRPNREHHQSSWHRDLPYQEYTISKPLGISAFYCIDPFNSETGATVLLPYSHKEEKLPSKNFVSENGFQVSANPGDVILFDCMVFHRAGYNSSNIIRRGVNNVFVAPLLKQQIDLPKMLKGKYQEDKLLNTLLGYKYQVAESVQDFRLKKIKRIE